MEDQIILDRLKKAFQSIDGASIYADECPDPEKIWDAQKGRLSTEETHAIIDHTSGCGPCAQAWRVALEISEPTELASADSQERGKVIRFPWLMPASAFAVAAVLVLAFAVQWQRPTTDLPGEISFRDSADAKEIRSLISGQQALPRTGFDLTWEHAFTGDVTFDIQVQNENLQAIAGANRITKTNFKLTPEVLNQVAPGSRILWQVVVRVDGERVKWSPTFVNVVE